MLLIVEYQIFRTLLLLRICLILCNKVFIVQMLFLWFDDRDVTPLSG